MKWIKASERLPKAKKQLSMFIKTELVARPEFVKVNGNPVYGGEFIFNTETDVTFYEPHERGGSPYSIHKDNFDTIEWLDEDWAIDIKDIIYDYLKHLQKNTITKSYLPLNDEIEHIDEWWEDNKEKY